ncbi:MAG: DNA cytosine methyltransferase, partial [Actinomycetota bacterium]|nr:DNA cytosine methyltransferase [Actinomycetota bacterium]
MESPRLRAAEFFAGIGLVRKALNAADIEVVWANDIEPCKRDMYVENFGAGHFRLGDVRDVRGDETPGSRVLRRRGRRVVRGTPWVAP